MNVLNKPIPYINTYDPNNPSLGYVDQTAAMQIWNEFDYDVWYCMFSCHHSFRIYKIQDLVPADILARVRAGEIFLLLDNALEPFLKSIDGIYDNIVVGAGIPPKQVILMCNLIDGAEYSKNVAQRYGTDTIRIMMYNLFEWDLHKTVTTKFPFGQFQTLESKPYPKKFLNLNRRWRLHRPVLMTLMYKLGLIDQGYISFGPCDPGDNWSDRWNEMINYYRDDHVMLTIFAENQGVKDLPPLYLDTNELHINRADFTHDTDQYYANTYFSVIAETTYHTKNGHPNARFLSEKTFKAIALRHPFIIVSVPGTLDVLRQMGYRTFSPIIDESYDLELDDGRRMLKIAYEIKRLCNLNPQDLEDFLTKAREICEHNRNVLYSRKTFLQEII